MIDDVAGKQPEAQWLDLAGAIAHCTLGLSIWEWASSDAGGECDVVMACCGDVPTLETLAAVSILRTVAPEIKVRVINIVDLMRLQPPHEHPHGLPDTDFDALFTTDKPVVFAFHGYPWLIHRLTYKRSNHDNFHVRGYKDEGTHAQIPKTGLSADYVYREAKRAREGLAGAKTQLWPGIDVDVPTATEHSKCTPDGVRDAVLAAFHGGADGVILSRKYSEMKLANLAGAGQAIQELGFS